MKKLLVVIVCICICSRTFAQDKLMIDSLLRALSGEMVDSSRASIMSDLCFQYRLVNTDSALLFGREALNLSRRIQYKIGEARTLSNLAFVMRDQGNLPIAMDYQFKALKYFQENQYHQEAGLSMVRLSSVYRDLQDYPKSLHYLRESFGEHIKANSRRGMAVTYMILGATYLDMNVLDSALFFEEAAYKLMDSVHFVDLYPQVFWILGGIYKKSDSTALALNYYRQSILAATGYRVRDNRSLAISSNSMAELYIEMNQPDSGIYYAKQSLMAAELISFRIGIIDAANLLSKIYEPIDLKQSYTYFKMATAAKDSIFNRVKFNAVQSMTAEKEENERKAEAEKKAYENSVRFYALIAGLSLFLVIAVYLYRNNRQKQKTNLFLQKTLANLKATQNQLIQSEKMASLGELTAGIAHEIQNPLNFVNNFSEVNKELLLEMKDEMDKGNFSDAKAIALDVMENEVKITQHGKRADAIVKGMLQHSRPSSNIKAMTDINKITDEYVRLAYHGLLSKDKSAEVTLKMDYDEKTGSIEIIPHDVGRVIHNLMYNAFYTVSEKKSRTSAAGNTENTVNGYEPVVSISTKRLEGKVLISVKDNGMGIPTQVTDKIFQPFFTTKPAGQGTGLGLSISYDIIKAHGGELTLLTKEGEGTDFIIQLPVVSA